MKVDLEKLRSLWKAEQSKAKDESSTTLCPECGWQTWQCDCWQIAALEAIPDMLNEISKSRKQIAKLTDENKKLNDKIGKVKKAGSKLIWNAYEGIMSPKDRDAFNNAVDYEYGATIVSFYSYPRRKW